MTNETAAVDLDRGQTFDAIARMASIFKRHIKLFLGVFALIFGGAALYTFQQTPLYSATAKVIVDPNRFARSAGADVTTDAPLPSSLVDALLDTEVEVLRSRALARRVVKDFQLWNDPEFNLFNNEATAVSGGTGFGGRANARGATPATLGKERKDKPDEDAPEFSAVLNTVLDRLTVERSGPTYVIDVTFTSQHPVKAAKIANHFATRFVRDQRARKADSSEEASELLRGRITELRRQVQKAEEAIASYRASNGLMSAEGANLTEQEISSLSNQLTLVQGVQAEKEARLRTARQQLASGSVGDNVAEALGSPVIANLRAQRSVVSRKSAELQSRYGERHPEVQRVERELADIDKQIGSEIKRVLSGLEAEAQVARRQAGSIATNLNRAHSQLARNNAATVRLNELERSAAAVRTLYENYLRRFEEITTRQGMEKADAQILSAADQPLLPTSPNIPLNLSFGLVLGLIGGTSAVFLARNTSSGLATADEVERIIERPCVGSIPLLSSTFTRADREFRGARPEEWVIARPNSAFTEAIRNLRASVMRSGIGGTTSQVLAITSALPNEGKTTTTLCLGRVTAADGRAVVLVDCDLRRRSVSKRLGLKSEAGLVEVLAGEASLDDALQCEQTTGLWILPTLAGSANTKDLLSTPAFDQLLRDLRTRFELVLLDLPPVLPVADVRNVAPMADAVLLLVRWRATHRGAVESANQILVRADAPFISVALNGVDVRQQARHGYGDPGYYYGSYSSYYSQ